MSYEQVHGPPATHPAQQNGKPTWNVAGPAIAISQVTQVNGVVVLGLLMDVLGAGARRAIRPLGVRLVAARRAPRSERTGGN